MLILGTNSGPCRGVTTVILATEEAPAVVLVPPPAQVLLNMPVPTWWSTEGSDDQVALTSRRMCWVRLQLLSRPLLFSSSPVPPTRRCLLSLLQVMTS